MPLVYSIAICSIIASILLGGMLIYILMMHLGLVDPNRGLGEWIE